MCVSQNPRTDTFFRTPLFVIEILSDRDGKFISGVWNARTRDFHTIHMQQSKYAKKKKHLT